MQALRRTCAWAAVAVALGVTGSAQQGRGQAQFPGGTNPDGSLRPSPPLTRLFTQDAYTEYEILEPGSASFRIRYLPEEPRVGATELVNATRGGSHGSDIEVYDPRTGNPLKFSYEQQPDDPESHAIRATLPIPVPQGGIGRVLIFKTYKDPRTYMMNGESLVWVRSLSGYRLGVILPPGFAFTSSNVAAHVTTVAGGKLKLAFANPSGQANPVTIHAHRSLAAFVPRPTGADVFFDDVKTLYDLGEPGRGRMHVEQTYSDYRKGSRARLDSLRYLALDAPRVLDLDTAKALPISREGGDAFAPLDVPIESDKQSAHLRLTGTLTDRAYSVSGGELVFDRTVHGLRNTVLLPPDYEVSAVSQPATIGRSGGRAFVSLINLNAENQYRVTIRARRNPPIEGRR